MSNIEPKRGEVWFVNFDPTIGAELKKTRPSIVISSDAVGILPVKLIAPITSWQSRYAQNLWHIKLDPDPDNGLSKPSVVDALQIRGVDTERFMHKLGFVPKAFLDEIAFAIAAIIEHP